MKVNLMTMQKEGEREKKKMMKKDNMVDRESNVNNNDLNYHLIVCNLD